MASSWRVVVLCATTTVVEMRTLIRHWHLSATRHHWSWVLRETWATLKQERWDLLLRLDWAVLAVRINKVVSLEGIAVN